MAVKAISCCITLVVLACISLTGAQRPPEFIRTCTSYVNEEIYYTGFCSIRYPYEGLGQIKDLIESMPDDMSLDEFVRTRLFVGLDKFFRESYNDVKDPLDFEALLDALIDEALQFANIFTQPGSLTKTLVGDFTDPFYKSGFNNIRSPIFSIFFEKYPEWTNCGIGGNSLYGFCPITHKILGTPDTVSQVTERNIDDVLRNYSQSVFNFYNSLTNFAGKSAFETLLTKIDTEGTQKTPLRDVKAFTGSIFYQAIRDMYLNETVTSNSYVKTTTPRATRPSTTTREKVIDAKAIDDIVLYLVPPLIVFAGFIAAALIVAYVYKFRPVVVNIHTQPVVVGGRAPNQEKKAEVAMEMNNLKY